MLIHNVYKYGETYIYVMVWVLTDEVRKIISTISSKKEFTEKELKKMLKIKENDIRKVLYKLEEYGIIYPIGMITIKEGKFDYKWGTRIQSKEKIYEIIINKEIKEIDEQMKELPEYIYYCEECGISYDPDTAEENDYKCKECESILIEKPNMKLFELKELKKKLEDLYKEEVIKEKEIKAYSK